VRLLIYGDSNSWGFPPDGSGRRMAHDARWPGVVAAKLGWEVIEDALPGRTTAHDDPQMLGMAMNGLRHLPVALKSHCPLDMVLIMLGTNDLKARFSPDAGRIAANLGRLVDCVREVGAGAGHWAEAAPVPVALIIPPPLPERVDDPGWERFHEWRGGRAASAGLAEAVAAIGRERDVPVFDAGQVVAGSREDPIHLDVAAHRALGHAVAGWLARIRPAP